MSRSLLVLAATFIGIGLVLVPVYGRETSRSIRFRPPAFEADREQTGNLRSRQSRCSCTKGSIVALLPETAGGLTIAARPDFIFYVPPLWGMEGEPVTIEDAANLPRWLTHKSSARSDTFIIEFVILNFDDEEVPVTVYETQFETDDLPGMIQLSLPETAPPLAVGSSYLWYFSLICDRDDRSGDEYTSGWIERIEPRRQLEQQIEAATEVDRAILYAENGLWYDAVATLATLKRSQPENTEMASLWQDLLSQVGLNSFAEIPFSEATNEGDRN